MARRGTKYRTLRLCALLVVAGLSWWLGKTNPPPGKSGSGGTPGSGKESQGGWPQGSAPGSRTESKGKSKTKTEAYEMFQNCRYEDHAQNDGDSFRVRLPDGQVEQFRLYFVDCPESQFRSYRGGDTNHQRIREQAEYFRISDEQAVEIGGRAKGRIREILSKGPFTLYTRWDDPFGDRRYHAFILPAGGPYLEETLVREGLARIHTKGAEMPDGLSFEARQEQLRKLEAEARKAKRGAWGMR